MAFESADTLFSLRNKTALITGSSRGLGLAMARGLGLAGATVVLNARDAPRLAEAVSELKREGIVADGCAFDVTCREDVEEKINVIENRYGTVDILVNNVGINRRAAVADIEESLWEAVIRTNLSAVLYVSQKVVKRMMHRQRGKIINTCSLMSEVARPTTGPYAVSKGGLKMLTRTMAVEWAKFNIQVNGIGPGYFSTELNQSLVNDRDFNDWVEARTPAGRWGQPADLMGTVVFLASHASDFITGQVIYVDGGILATL